MTANRSARRTLLQHGAQPAKQVADNVKRRVAPYSSRDRGSLRHMGNRL